MVEVIDDALAFVSRFYFRVSQALLALLVVGIFSQVLLRYFLGSSILGAAELTKLAMTWLVFLMAVVLHRRRRHIEITALIDVLGPRMRRAAEVLVNVAVISLACFSLPGGFSDSARTRATSRSTRRRSSSRSA